MDMITKLSNIACVIQCGGVWFANGKFGVTWRLVQAVVKPQETFKGKCHLFLTESEKEKMVGSNQVEMTILIESFNDLRENPSTNHVHHDIAISNEVDFIRIHKYK